jgi:hypothetical protein
MKHAEYLSLGLSETGIRKTGNSEERTVFFYISSIFVNYFYDLCKVNLG